MSFIDIAPPHPAAPLGARDPERLVHALGAEPLLTRAALAEAAARLPESMIERRVHDAADGAGFRVLPPLADLAQCLGEGGPHRAWVMLKGLESLPEYASLFARCLAVLPPAILSAAGPVRDVRAFVFLSAPHTRTPLHFDAEYNVLFHLEGTKTFTTFPPGEPFVSLAAREAYHETGDNLLEPNDAHAVGGTRHELGPDDALFVPWCAPHAVRCGPTPSISLSLTWQNSWSRDVAEAVRLGARLRRFGLTPRDPVLSARRPRLAAFVSRMLQRFERALQSRGSAA
ncbi:transcription factor jumonji, JmjC [Erythrobacter sp.]|uniref:transcription factor jumonji, JmjC n=1 Tax=Erythrobacter sp. TaxID=1042 RepID=UPI001425C4EE|nr:transcription factor jumonji, JmjC [Erythrobacter sp.]QIQ87049.1 MAG: transcription factor jumonji, JmjC [Erythrobacter sp.]